MVYESQISFTLDTICPWCVVGLLNDSVQFNAEPCLVLGLIWRRKGHCARLLTGAGLMICSWIRLDIGMAKTSLFPLTYVLSFSESKEKL